MIPTPIETDRLILRPFTLEDVPDIHTMDHDPEVNRYTGEPGQHSVEQIEDIIQNRIQADYRTHGFGRLAVFHKKDQRTIGFAGLKFLEDYEEVDIGYRLMSPYWGVGLATEAGKAILQYGFETIGLEKIVGMVMPENIASIRVLEKLGFSMIKNIVDEGIPAQWFELKRADYQTT